MSQPLIRSTIFIFIFFLSTSVKGQVETLNSFSFEQIDSLYQIEKRPLAIFIHADWCKYCQHMKQSTLKDEQIVEVLNNSYYYISFNSEQRESIKFAGQEFYFQPTGRDQGTHMLAEALGSIDGQLSLPAFTILNDQAEISFQYGAYLTARQLLQVLTFK